MSGAEAGRSGGASWASGSPDILHVMTVPMSLRFLRGQVGYMKDRGCAIEIACSEGEELSRFGREHSVRVHPVTMSRAITPGRDLISLARLFLIVIRRRPRIVHAHTPKGGLLGMIAGWLSRVPVRVYHMRGLPLMTATGWRRRLLELSERVSCRLAHRVICVSHGLRSYAVEAGICPAHKIVVLAHGSGNGVDAEGEYDPARWGEATRTEVRRRHHIPPQAPVVLFVGRLTTDKGVAELAAAWASIREEHPDAHLLLVGPREATEEPVIDALRSLEGDARVRFAGMQGRSAPYFAAADVLVLPTYREGFPNVVLEAGAMELPVVTTRVPGCEEAVVDGETGLLVPPRDAQALGDAIRRYLSDPALRRRHGAAARARTLELFRPSLVWSALHEEYRRLLAEKGIGSVPERGDRLPQGARG